MSHDHHEWSMNEAWSKKEWYYYVQYTILLSKNLISISRDTFWYLFYVLKEFTRDQIVLWYICLFVEIAASTDAIFVNLVSSLHIFYTWLSHFPLFQLPTSGFNATINLSGPIILGLGIASSLLLYMFFSAFNQRDYHQLYSRYGAYIVQKVSVIFQVTHMYYHVI